MGTPNCTIGSKVPSVEIRTTYTPAGTPATFHLNRPPPRSWVGASKACTSRPR